MLCFFSHLCSPRWPIQFGDKISSLLGQVDGAGTCPIPPEQERHDVVEGSRIEVGGSRGMSDVGPVKGGVQACPQRTVLHPQL